VDAFYGCRSTHVIYPVLLFKSFLLNPGQHGWDINYPSPVFRGGATGGPYWAVAFFLTFSQDLA
jgi:hypothetical protein